MSDSFKAPPPAAATIRAPFIGVPADAPGSLLPTAAIVGLLQKHRVEHPWLAGVPPTVLLNPARP